MATINKVGKISYQAVFDDLMFINVEGNILVDLTIYRWDDIDTSSYFNHGSTYIKFNIRNEVKKIKTKLLLGIPVTITVMADYEFW